MSLIFENKVPSSYRSEFVAKVKDISSKLGIDPNWLMAIIDLESSGTFSPSITNKYGYTGLIQFGDDAAKSLGTTTANLRGMTAVQQLDYVYKYFLPKKDQLKTYVDTYLHVFFPMAVGKGDDFLIQGNGLTASKIAGANPSLNSNGDDKIYVWEIKKALLKRLPNEWLNNGSFSLAVKAYKDEFLTIGIIAFIGASIYYYKHKYGHGGK